ncbi:MAG: dipeptidase PepE [Marinilabiliales bacterium]
MKLLLISNSTLPGEPYLDYPKNNIKEFLGNNQLHIIFIPYAAVTFSFDEYEKKVNDRLAEVGHKVTGIHKYEDKIEAVKNADAIIVGGGNTFHLVKLLQEERLIEPIREKVINGTPYVGWSAGSNVACPTICTTNDMPIVQPPSFNVLKLIPFQINPHYLDANPENHAGETREQRIEEFLEVNQNVYVAGLREGTMFQIENNNIKLIGDKTCRIFKYGKNPVELSKDDDFSFLLKD